MKSGCPTPLHCHRTPRCEDGCEDPEAIKNYKATLRKEREARIAALQKELDEMGDE